MTDPFDSKSTDKWAAERARRKALGLPPMMTPQEAGIGGSAIHVGEAPKALSSWDGEPKDLCLNPACGKPALLITGYCEAHSVEALIDEETAESGVLIAVCSGPHLWDDPNEHADRAQEAKTRPPTLPAAIEMAEELRQLRQENAALRQAFDLLKKGVASIPGSPPGEGAYIVEEATIESWRRQVTEALRLLGEVTEAGTYRLKAGQAERRLQLLLDALSGGAQ